MGVNRVMLLGNVGADPVIRTTQQGQKIATFSLATTDTWKDKITREQKSITVWHKIVVFPEGLVKIIEKYVVKGSKLFIEGQIEDNEYTGKDGVKRIEKQVALRGFNNKLEIIENRKGESEVQEVNGNIADDDIPF